MASTSIGRCSVGCSRTSSAHCSRRCSASSSSRCSARSGSTSTSTSTSTWRRPSHGGGIGGVRSRIAARGLRLWNLGRIPPAGGICIYYISTDSNSRGRCADYPLRFRAVSRHPSREIAAPFRRGLTRRAAGGTCLRRRSVCAMPRSGSGPTAPRAAMRTVPATRAAASARWGSPPAISSRRPWSWFPVSGSSFLVRPRSRLQARPAGHPYYSRSSRPRDTPAAWVCFS